MEKPLTHVAPCGHLHVRVVMAQCPQGHGMAALVGTSPALTDEALIEGFATLIEGMPDLAAGCQVCGAPRDTWSVEVHTSPPLASQAAADALVTQIATTAMGETVITYELAGGDLVPTVIH